MSCHHRGRPLALLFEAGRCMFECRGAEVTDGLRKTVVERKAIPNPKARLSQRRQHECLVFSTAFSESFTSPRYQESVFCSALELGGCLLPLALILCSNMVSLIFYDYQYPRLSTHKQGVLLSRENQPARCLGGSIFIQVESLVHYKTLTNLEDAPKQP